MRSPVIYNKRKGIGTSSDIRSLRESILRDFIKTIDYNQKYGCINETLVQNLSKKIERFVTLSERAGTNIKESAYFERKFLFLCEQTSFHKYEMFTMNEGFMNPFDNTISSPVMYNKKYDEYLDNRVSSLTNSANITNVKLWDSNCKEKTYYKRGGIYSGKPYSKGDIIEKCLVRLIEEKDLYSDTIRDFAFTIDPSNHLYAIAFGNGSFYNNSHESQKEPNVTYEYVEAQDEKIDGYIKIIALRNIKKDNELIIKSDETDFENEIKPGQFKYEQGVEPAHLIKNIKLV